MIKTYRPPERIQTERFLLRPVKFTDAESIFQSYAYDPRVTRYMGWKAHKSPSETSAYVRRVMLEWDEGTGFPLVVFSKAAPDVIIGMFHPHLHRTRVNYGYVLCKDAWGQGCATEILHWLVADALDHPSIHRAEAFCDVENRASARVMEKAGMTKEGLLRRYFIHPNLSDAPRDCLMYSKVR